SRIWVLALVAACGGAATTPHTHKPGDEWLVGLAIESADKTKPLAIASDDLLPALALKRNAENERAIDDYQLQLDIQRITKAFQKLGYFNVDVKTRLDKVPNSGAGTLVFVVNQGKQATTHIELSGLPSDVALADALHAIEVREGKPFVYDQFDDAKGPLL